MNQNKTTLKAELHQNKDHAVNLVELQRRLYFEVLPRNQAINSDVYCQKLIKLAEAIEEKVASIGKS